MDYVTPGMAGRESDGGSRGTVSSWRTNHSGFNYKFILYRGKDQLTLCDFKNNSFSPSAKGFLGGLSNNSSYNFKSQNTPRKTRLDKEQYKDAFSADIVGGSLGWGLDQTTVYGSHFGADGMCADQYSPHRFQDYSKFSANATVNIDVYWANKESPDFDGKIEDYVNSKERHMLSAGQIKFVPYVLMQYQDKQGAFKRVDVLSEYKRTLNPYDYIQYHITKPNANPLESIHIDSEQWTGHKTAEAYINKYLGGETPAVNGVAYSSMLPGGATYSFGIKESDTRVVKVLSIQAYMADTGLEHVKKTGGSIGKLKTDQTFAKESHKKMVEEAVQSFKDTSIRQYGLNGEKGRYNLARDRHSLFRNGQTKQLVPGEKFNGITLSEDSKYYFNNYENSKLDVNYVNNDSYDSSTETHTYTFYVNTMGEIRCLVDNTSADGNSMDGVLIANKGSNSVIGYNSSSAWSEASYVAERTGIVKSLRKALIDNKGDDTSARWVGDGKWYNEAFDGITYIWQKTEFAVGIWDPAERMTVSDPRFTPEQNPCKDVIIPLEGCIEVETKKQFTLTEEELKLLKDGCLEKLTYKDEYVSRNGIVLMLLANLGLRIEEYLGILREYDKRNGIKSEYVACTQTGNISSPINFSRTLESVKKRMKLNSKISLHTLRHTFCSHLIKKNIRVEVVSKLMGHSNITVTYNNYIHVLQEEAAEAMSKVSIC